MPGYEPCRFLETSSKKDSLCSICEYIMKNPVQCSKCNFICCQECKNKGYNKYFNPLIYLKYKIIVKTHYMRAFLLCQLYSSIKNRGIVYQMQKLDQRLHGNPEN